MALGASALLSATGCARSAAASFDSGTGDDTPDAARAVDGHPDAPTHLDSSAVCAISDVPAPALDGNDDLAKYPVEQQLAPGAMLGTDMAAIAWDAQRLYVTVVSSAFTNAFEPLHIYVETDQLVAPVVSTGKEYSGLVPGLPFTATHLIAVRSQSDAGSGDYDGVFLPDATWTDRATPLATGTDVFVATDNSAISIQVPWTALGGCPTSMRLATHVVHAVVANEWKNLVPATHTPWLPAGGGYYEIDLTGAHTVASWSLH